CVGQLPVELAQALGARVGRERPELGVDRRSIVDKEDLRIAPEDRQATTEQTELARDAGPHGRTVRRRRREGILDRTFVIVVGERVEGRTRRASRRRERVDDRRVPWGRKGVVGERWTFRRRRRG